MRSQRPYWRIAMPRSEGLDWVINEARESGIRLILTLTDSRGDYGGMPEYVRAVMGEQGSIKDFYTSKTIRVRRKPHQQATFWSRTASMGAMANGTTTPVTMPSGAAPLKRHHSRPIDDTDSSLDAQNAFKDYIGTLVLHKSTVSGMYLRDDPTILGWELVNSPLCPGDDSGDAVQVPDTKLIRCPSRMPVTVITKWHVGRSQLDWRLDASDKLTIIFAALPRCDLLFNLAKTPK